MREQDATSLKGKEDDENRSATSAGYEPTCNKHTSCL